MTPTRVRRTRRTIAAVTAVALLGLAGCASPKPGDTVSEGPAAQHPNVELRLTPTDLQDRLRIEAIRSGQLGELRRVQITLRNVTSSPMTVEYRAAWRDAAGFKVGSSDVWQPLDLGSGGMDELQFGAPSPAGERLVLQLREAD